MKPRPIPTNFILERVNLTWREAIWALNHKWFSWASLVDLAVYRLEESSNHPLEVDLAGVDKSDSWRAVEVAKRLADSEPLEAEGVIERKWLFLVLYWLFEHRTDFPDALALVEELYADFGYPEEIEAFVRFMPERGSYDPTKHSREENEERLFSKWREYLAMSKADFGKGGSNTGG